MDESEKYCKMMMMIIMIILIIIIIIIKHPFTLTTSR